MLDGGAALQQSETLEDAAREEAMNVDYRMLILSVLPGAGSFLCFRHAFRGQFSPGFKLEVAFASLLVSLFLHMLAWSALNTFWSIL